MERGIYVGTYLALQTLERYWWGEGEVNFIWMVMRNILPSVELE